MAVSKFRLTGAAVAGLVVVLLGCSSGNRKPANEGPSKEDQEVERQQRESIEAEKRRRAEADAAMKKQAEQDAAKRKEREDEDRRAQGEQAAKEKERRDYQASQEAETKKRQEEDATEGKKLAAAREAALKGAINKVKLVDVLNDPSKYAGQVVRVEGRLVEVVGKLSFVDEVASATACKLVLAPPFKTKPGLGVVISFEDWQADLAKYENLKRSQVEAVLYVSKGPAAEMTDESPCIGRLYEIKAK